MPNSLGRISNPPSNTPIPWSLFDGDLGAGTAGTLAANTTYLVGVWLPVAAIATGMVCRSGTTAAGHIDMGIYDVNGNLLGHSGVSTYAASSVVNLPLLSNVSLPAGRYW